MIAYGCIERFGTRRNLTDIHDLGAANHLLKGTGYNYPDQLPVVMGSSVVIDRGEEDRARQPDKTAAKN